MIPDFDWRMLQAALPVRSKATLLGVVLGKRTGENNAIFKLYERSWKNRPPKIKTIRRATARALTLLNAFKQLDRSEQSTLEQLGDEAWTGDIDLTVSGWSRAIQAMDRGWRAREGADGSLRHSLPFTFETLELLDSLRPPILGALRSGDTDKLAELVGRAPYQHLLARMTADEPLDGDEATARAYGAMLSLTGIVYLIAALDAELALISIKRSGENDAISRFAGLMEKNEGDADSANKWWLAMLCPDSERPDYSWWLRDNEGISVPSRTTSLSNWQRGKRPISLLAARDLVKMSCRQKDFSVSDDDLKNYEFSLWSQFALLNFTAHLRCVFQAFSGSLDVGELVDDATVGAFKRLHESIGLDPFELYASLFEVAVSECASRCHKVDDDGTEPSS